MSWTKFKPRSSPTPNASCDLSYWLALSRAPGVGSRTFLNLLETHSPAQLFSESSSALAALGLNPAAIEAIKNPDWHIIDNDLSWSTQSGHHLITLNHPLYPEQLKQISDPPPVLFVRGQVDLLSGPQIAIVGSRNPSTLGRETAFEFAKALSAHGFVISSGLALGIDAAGHEGALHAQGPTIAVVGTGPDRIYPAVNKNLASRIIEQGAIVTELPPGTPAKAHHFPRRNRIISGLCQGLLVVEAAKESGSLISARLALEQNREVFAIPGSIHNPLARGCNALIREGAKLVETVQDIIEELHQYYQKDTNYAPTPKQSMLDLEQQTLLNLVMYDPISIDYLVEKTGKSVEMIASMLLILELNGYISAVAGGCYTRIK
ncbi:DNA-processing protein DprA [Methylomicrobium sp. Wu6]|uniref:DNA-processing protein DprA n=1 Tax=Methylomicrobium sp. Wu6 TaxID=3107928 RepID=UPI002DD6B6EC|nr:DNA-processing protein DprA [Methylomicrobium sp. Wu6]MEC4749498.1 DNA-processing protein DprA [Methylomicrobium sp. Wu6]